MCHPIADIFTMKNIGPLEVQQRPSAGAVRLGGVGGVVNVITKRQDSTVTPPI
jgi:outer membrane receptor for ferrienterochelin and colicin